MDEQKVRDLLRRMIDGCGRTARDAERRAQQRPDEPLIDVEWFRVMRSKAKACLEALDAGDTATFEALIGEIETAKDQLLWVTMTTQIEAQVYHLGPWSPAELTKGQMTRGRPMVLVAWDDSPRGPNDVFAIRAADDTDEVLLNEAGEFGFKVLDVE
jgi:hypothetical protein